MKIKSFSKNTIKRINYLILIAIIIFCNTIIFIPNKAQAASYNQVVINANSNNNNGIDAFPESYRNLLNKLVDSTGHDNWKFKAFYTDIDWKELTSTSNENACYRNTVYKGNDSRWYCSANHTKAEYGGDGYYCASGKIVNYYLDPRNFLTETTIFQFLDLSNNSPASISDIQKALNGSFMQGNCSTGESYAQIIYDAAAASGENALSIVAKIYQEIGKSSPGVPPKMAAGTDSTYPRTYNFFNYGATDGTGAVTRGLAYANNARWYSERTAIVEGAKLIANSYIKAGQNTKYTFKFDVVGSEKKQLYSHQYMTNIQDPTNQSKILFDNYTNNGWLNNELTFVIPVYKNMPASIKKPSNLSSGNLYYVSSNYIAPALRSGPGTGYSNLGNLSKDTVVNLVQANVKNANGYTWSKISTESGTVGYFANCYLTPINTKVDTYSVPSQPADNTSNSGNGNSNATANYKIEGNKIITEPGTTVKKIKEKYTVTSAKKDGTNIGDTDNLGTGAVITTNAGTFTVVKLGDINGDGEITPLDYVQVKNHIRGSTKITNEYKIKAADLNNDNEVSPLDYVNIKNYITKGNKITI